MSDQLFSLSALGNLKEIMVGWEKVAALCEEGSFGRQGELEKWELRKV
jgi:hypothetical protein